MIIINLKTYQQGTGNGAEKITEKCGEASKNTGEKVVVSPSLPDLGRLRHAEIEIFSQHLDPVKPGSHTGHITPENLLENDASGTLLNHSERRIETEKIREAVERASQEGLTTVVCAQNPEECEDYSRFNPDFIAYEPPELIGGATSVAEAKPELIKQAVKRSSTKVLTGAGISSREDVEKAVELGCEGVLVASAVVKAENPREKIEELCRGL